MWYCLAGLDATGRSGTRRDNIPVDFVVYDIVDIEGLWYLYLPTAPLLAPRP